MLRSNHFVSLLGLPFACARNRNAPETVGVPERTPSDASVMPAGSEPWATTQEVGVPPVTCS